MAFGLHGGEMIKHTSRSVVLLHGKKNTFWGDGPNDKKDDICRSGGGGSVFFAVLQQTNRSRSLLEWCQFCHCSSILFCIFFVFFFLFSFSW